MGRDRIPGTRVFADLPGSGSRWHGSTRSRACDGPLSAATQSNGNPPKPYKFVAFGGGLPSIKSAADEARPVNRDPGQPGSWPSSPTRASAVPGIPLSRV